MNAPHIGNPLGGVVCTDGFFSVVLSGLSTTGLRWCPGERADGWVMWVESAHFGRHDARAVVNDFGDLVAVRA